MKNMKEIDKAIKIILNNPENIAWMDFSDKGSCSGPFELKDKVEIIEEAISLARVRILLPKGSEIQRKLSKIISNNLNNKWISYDWLIKVVGRLIFLSKSYNEFQDKMFLSLAVTSAMKKRGLTKIKV